MQLHPLQSLRHVVGGTSLVSSNILGVWSGREASFSKIDGSSSSSCVASSKRRNGDERRWTIREVVRRWERRGRWRKTFVVARARSDCHDAHVRHAELPSARVSLPTASCSSHREPRMCRLQCKLHRWLHTPRAFAPCLPMHLHVWHVGWDQVC